MSDEARLLVGYRLQRAEESLTDAQLLQRAARWNACANRLYYAAYYAISALLVAEGFDTSKHTGVRALFNQHFVKPGRIDQEYGRLYNRLFDLRQESDYIDFADVPAADVASLFEPTAALIAAIRAIVMR